ncbi:MAG TPA: hypothetical protein ENK28_13695 [Aliiroseovarius sp.]|nr:hypothetical protein [Aliiroseovarius sp.]
MSFIPSEAQFEAANVLDLVARERAMSLSSREWKHRLVGYGYAIRETDKGPVVETLTMGQEICALPATLH